MYNIKQTALKFIISFTLLIAISSCSQITTLFNSEKEPENSKVPEQKITNIAILLPITGSEAKLSKEYAQMIKIGLSDGVKSKVRVTTYDSTTQEKLNTSLDKILSLDTEIVIGPIYSRSTNIVNQKAKESNTIFLSLSNNPVLASKNVYIYGHAPMRQLEHMTNYFLDNNYQNFVALLPNGRYSSTVSTILNEIITNKKGKMEKIELYENSPEEIHKSVTVVSNIVDSINEDDMNLKQPVVIIADDTETLQILYKYAKEFNLDKKAVITGDNRIDINHNPHLDVVFTGSPNITDTYLNSRSMKAGINHISFMHALAYDAGRMIGNYVGEGYNRDQFLEQINSTKLFNGISGNIYFIDSIAQRQYDIIKKEDGQYKPESNNMKSQSEN